MVAVGIALVQELHPLRRKFAAQEAAPVMLPPGWSRLATSPSATGSPAVKMTIGIVAVAAFAAGAAGVVAGAAITLTWRRTRSAARVGNRSFWPSAQRYSIATF